MRHGLCSESEQLRGFIDSKKILLLSPILTFTKYFLFLNNFLFTAQGLSSDPIFLVENLSGIAPGKHQEVKKLLAKNIEKRMPIEKVWSAQNESEALNLLRCNNFF